MTQQDLQQDVEPIVWPVPSVPQTGLQDAIHEPHQEERIRVLEALMDDAHPYGRKAALRMASCGCRATITVDPDTGETTPWIQRCCARLCPFCGRRRATMAADAIFQAMQTMPRPRVCILTVKSQDAPLKRQLDRLRASFRRLRNTQLWKHRVDGGIYTVEVTLNPETNLWHPHVHILFDGNFIPQNDLREEWHRITGDSQIVWLQDANRTWDQAYELAKYIGKPQHSAEWPPAKLREYAHAIKGARMLQGFGTLKKLGYIDADRDIRRPAKGIRLSVTEIIKLAARGCDTAQRLAEALARRFCLFGRAVYLAMPQLKPELTQAEKTALLIRILTPGPKGDPMTRAPPDDDPALALKILLLATRYKAERDAGDYAAYEPEPDFRRWH